MAIRYRRITKIVFIVLHAATAVAFVLASIAPYLNPKNWWLISLIGLGFGFLLVTLIAFIFFWLVFRPRFILLSIIPLAIGYKGISVFFGFHVTDKFVHEKAPGSIRLVHWNVARFTEWRKNNNRGSQTRLKMMDLIKEQNADVLCFQEFFTSTDPQYYNNLQYVLKELGYPNYYFSWDGDGYRQWVGQAIFSRLPIIDSGLIRFPRPSMPEALVHIDIAKGSDTLRIFTTHLQSVQFKKEDFETIEKIKNTDEVKVETSRGIFAKLKRGVINRARQADIVKQVVSQSPYPSVLTGDFNDVPNSYTYFTIREAGLTDAFLENGLGIGRTFRDISPTLRIDYILHSPRMAIRQFNRVDKNLSDHYMLVADIAVKK